MNSLPDSVRKITINDILTRIHFQDLIGYQDHGKKPPIYQLIITNNAYDVIFTFKSIEGSGII